MLPVDGDGPPTPSNCLVVGTRILFRKSRAEDLAAPFKGSAVG